MPEEVRVRFLNSVIGEFDIKEEYHNVMKAGGKARDVIQLSINEHTLMVVENGEDLLEALELIKLLDKDIEFRIKQYSYCISKTTESYLTWLQTEYRRKLEYAVRQHYF